MATGTGLGAGRPVGAVPGWGVIGHCLVSSASPPPPQASVSRPVPCAGCPALPAAWPCGCGPPPPPQCLSFPICPPGAGDPLRPQRRGVRPASWRRSPPRASGLQDPPRPAYCEAVTSCLASRRPCRAAVPTATPEPWSRWRTPRAARRRQCQRRRPRAGGGRCERDGVGGARPPPAGPRGPIPSPAAAPGPPRPFFRRHPRTRGGVGVWGLIVTQ